MKLIEAFFLPGLWTRVKDALADIGVQGVTVSEAKGCGRPWDDSDTDYRDGEGNVLLIKIEIAVSDERVEEITKAITETLRTGRKGYALIYVLTIESAIRIRDEATDALIV